MSRPPIIEVTHPVDAAVLSALRDAGAAMNTAQLVKRAQRSRTIVARHLVRLLEAGFIEPAEVPLTPDTRRAAGMGRVARHYAITRSASLALARWRRRQGEPGLQPAPPAHSNLFARPVLQPGPPAYCRNGGNKHIPSRGYSC